MEKTLVTHTVFLTAMMVWVLPSLKTVFLSLGGVFTSFHQPQMAGIHIPMLAQIFQQNVIFPKHIKLLFINNRSAYCVLILLDVESCGPAPPTLQTGWMQATSCPKAM